MKICPLSVCAAFGFLVCLLASAEDPQSKIEQPVLRIGCVPVGALGYPVGSYLTIEGAKPAGNFKLSTRALRIDTVNGKKLAKPVSLEIENVGDLPSGKRCIIKGYETLTMIGDPPAYFEAAKEAGKEATAQQAGWQIYLYFKATSVVTPKELKIEKDI